MLPTRCSLLIACAFSVLTACRSEGSPASEKGSSESNGALAQFLKDYAQGSATFRSKYPAGKAFTMTAKVIKDGSCGAARCSITLGESESNFLLFELAADQKNVASIKAGQTVTLACTPVYKEGEMWTGAGCTVK
jgi:hypothetical protein